MRKVLRKAQLPLKEPSSYHDASGFCKRKNLYGINLVVILLDKHLKLAGAPRSGGDREFVRPDVSVL